MRTLRVPQRFVLVAVVLIAAMPLRPAAAQDPLARAKEFYASASYDEALQLLDGIHGSASSVPGSGSEAAAYQVFCLLALGRNDDAKQAIDTLVHVDPLYRPADNAASPRVMAFFDEVRRPLLPSVVRSSYAAAKSAYDRQDMSTALVGFTRVLTLIEQINPKDDAGLSDLRTLAGGFRDLSQTALAASMAAAAKAAPAEAVHSGPPESDPPAAPAGAKADKKDPAAPVLYSDADRDVTAPVALARMMPRWQPADSFEARHEYRGSIEVLVAETGKVLSVTMAKSVTPKYDLELIRAAQAWVFQPATRQGQPVRYKLKIDIHVTP